MVPGLVKLFQAAGSEILTLWIHSLGSKCKVSLYNVYLLREDKSSPPPRDTGHASLIMMEGVGRRKNIQGWEEADSKHEPGETHQYLWSVHLLHVWGLPSVAAWNFVASSNARLSRLKSWTECPEHSCLCYWSHLCHFLWPHNSPMW